MKINRSKVKQVKRNKLSETVLINKDLSDKEKYIALIPQVENLLNEEDNYFSNLANFTAAIKQSFDKVSWAGFYLFDGNKLVLGPFQGKVACTNINIGNGVCGASAERKETIIVKDVNEFPGHIACDSESRSEIVVPIMNDENLFGVLDLDSTSYNSFNETDKFYLEKLIDILNSKINFKKIIL
ncbi:MAG: GAF domain-containing protein [Ignavibacteriales bacterium]|nr:MAG: GAF domain-containing protein [Ignavibacteriales bacterium]